MIPPVSSPIIASFPASSSSLSTSALSPQKTNDVAMERFDADNAFQKSIQRQSCCRRFWSLAYFYSYPLSRIIEIIINAFKALIQCCIEFSDEIGPPSHSQRFFDLSPDNPHDEVVYSKSKPGLANVISRNGNRSHIKGFQNDLKRIKAEIGSLGLSANGNLALDTFQSIQQKVDSIKKAFQLTHSLLTNSNKKSQEFDSFQIELESLLKEWNQIIRISKDSLITKFENWQMEVLKKLSHYKTVTLTPMVNGQMVDPKCEGIKTYREYIQMFSFLNYFGWAHDDINHRSILNFKDVLACSVGLPNFKKGASNICWMNSVVQAMRFVPALWKQDKQSPKLSPGQQLVRSSFLEMQMSISEIEPEGILQAQIKLKDALNEIRSLQTGQMDRAGKDQLDPDELILRPVLEVFDNSMGIATIIEADNESSMLNSGSDVAWRLGFGDISPGTPINYEDLLDSSGVENINDPENKWKGHEKYTIRRRLSEYPEVLVVQLKRFKMQTPFQISSPSIQGYAVKPKFVKMDDPVIIKEEMEMSQLKISPENSSNKKYYLSACVCHKGSIDSGHFFSICKSDGIWRKLDDDHPVQIITTQEALEHASRSYIQFWT